LLVADLDVAPNEKVEELAVGPDFAEAQLEEAARRLNSNGGSAGGERESGGRGCRQRSHALREKTSERVGMTFIRVSKMRREIRKW
jgi:hypothetical protein